MAQRPEKAMELAVGGMIPSDTCLLYTSFPLHHLVEAGWWNVENSVGKVEKSKALPFPVDHCGRWKRGELPVISRWEPGGISVETGRKTIAGR